MAIVGAIFAVDIHKFVIGKFGIKKLGTSLYRMTWSIFFDILNRLGKYT